jgi:outer membrane receptor protein involved in Fe transport
MSAGVTMGAVGRGGAILWLALAMAGATAARAATASEPSITVGEVVVTHSRADLLGKAITASQGSVTQEALQLRPAYRVGQLLETVPGLVVTVHSGEGKAYQYLLRGFNLDHGTDIANFIDDMPVNRPTNAHGQGYSDLNFVIPEVLQGLDYTKGTYYPSVGDFGDVASEHMRLADVLPAQIAASAGTLGDQNVFVGGSHDLNADSHLLAAVEATHVDGPFHPGNDFRKYAGIVRFSQGTAANGDDLTLMYYKGDGKFITDQPVRAVQEGLIGRFGTLDPTDGNSSERLSLSGHYAVERGGLSLTSNAYYVHSRQTLWNNFTHFLEDPVNGDQEQQDETRDLFGGGAAAALKSSFGAIDSLTTLGVQGRYDDIYVDRRHTTRRKVLDYCELLSPDGVTATPVEVGEPDCTADRVHLGDVGLYLENNTHWTPWLRTDLGLRQEFYRGEDRSLLPDSAFRQTPFSEAVTLFQPKGSIVLGPWWDSEFYLSAGRGFHSDDLRGVSGSVPLEGLGGARTAPLLVKADSEEVGLRSNIVPNLHVQIAAFNVRLNSEIVYDQDQGEDQPGPQSDRYGVEVSAEYKPLPWLELNTDLAFSHAQFVQISPANLMTNFGDSGNHIPLAPGFIGSFGVIVDDLGPWYGSVQERLFGPYALVSDNSERDDGYSETNLSIGYKVSGTLKAEVEVFNLFNVRANSAAFFYTTDIHDGLGPTADHQTHPLEPLSARATVTAFF